MTRRHLYCQYCMFHFADENVVVFFFGIPTFMKWKIVFTAKKIKFFHEMFPANPNRLNKGLEGGGNS